MKDHTKEFRITIATDSQTYNALKNLALEQMTTTSQIGDSYIKKGIIEESQVPETTKRYFNLEILTRKSAQIVENMRNYDEFYEFKRNISEICMNLNGNLGPIYEDGVAGCGIKDLTDLFLEVKESEPELFKKCIPILKKNLSKAQRDLVIDSVY